MIQGKTCKKYLRFYSAGSIMVLASQVLAGGTGYPSQVQDRCTPSPTSPSQDQDGWEGVPQSGPRTGVPPPSPRQHTPQTGYHRRQYAACAHAGLSCSFFFLLMSLYRRQTSRFFDYLRYVVLLSGAWCLEDAFPQMPRLSENGSSYSLYGFFLCPSYFY